MAKKNKKAKQLKRMMREMQRSGYGGTPRTGLSSLLPSRPSNQLLLGLALGGAVAYVLSDEALRGRIMKAGAKLYADLAGGFEEMKEQMADIQAELAAEQEGNA